MTPLHKWTNGSDAVLVLRVIEADGTSYGGFSKQTLGISSMRTETLKKYK